MTSKVLIVTGMHRSGTSLIAQYMSECGLNIGSNLFNPHITNPEKSCAGHHEDLDFIGLHQQVFKRYRVDSSALLIDGSELPFDFNAAEHAAALKLLADRRDLAQWGWKDPRTTLFLQLWYELIDGATFLLPFRHPLAVVDSLLRRGNEKPISRRPIMGLRAWSIYNQQIINFVRQHPEASVPCDIDDLIAAPAPLLARLQDRGLALTPARMEDVFSKKAFHAQYSPQVQKMAAKYPQEVREAEALYQQLQNLCKVAA